MKNTKSHFALKQIQGILVVCLSIISLGSMAANFTSNAPAPAGGEFNTGATWAGGTAPSATCTDNGSGNITIRSTDYVYSNCATLIFSGSRVITVKGKMEIFGNLKVTGSAVFTVDPGAQLIVHGDLDMGNGAATTVTITGNMTVFGSALGNGNPTFTCTGNIQFGGTGCGMCDGGGGSCSNNVTLPVILTGIKGVFNPNSNSNEIYWTTSAERNIKEYVIQRSMDGYNFYDIGKETSNGDTYTQKLHSYSDNYPETKTSFYRLKIVDQDQNYSFSTIISINKDGANLSMDIVPNPSKSGEFSLYFSFAKKVTITVFDLLGNTYLNQTMDLTQGSIIQASALNSDLPSGIYYIYATSENGSVKSKMIIY